MGSLAAQLYTAFNTSWLINDQQSGATADVSFWVPTGITTPSTYYLGLMATPNYTVPPNPISTYYVYSPSGTNALPPLVAPSSFHTVWTCSGNDKPSNLGIYNPVAPSGYVAIGSVAVMNFNHQPSPLDFFGLMCVRSDLTVQVTLGANDLIWTDRGSGASGDVSVWRLPYSGVCFAAAGYPTTITATDVAQP